jgi:hypothetical protein
MKYSGGKDLDTEGLAMIRVSETDQCKAAYNTVCNSTDAADAAILLTILGLTPLQARRGKRLARRRV